MSAFKGTPGPWALTESTECEYVMVVGANGSGLFCENVDHPGAREDARLIAAAPELLEALQKVDEQLGDVECESSADARAVERCHETIRAAIAKATGGDA